MGAAFRGSGASRKTRTGSRRFQREHPSGWGKPEIEAGAWINIPRPVAPGALGYDEMKNFLKSFLRDESGASAAEYALILVVVGVAIVGAAGFLSDAIGDAMSDTASIINER